MNFAPGALRAKRVDVAVGSVKRLDPLSLRLLLLFCWYGIYI